MFPTEEGVDRSLHEAIPFEATVYSVYSTVFNSSAFFALTLSLSLSTQVYFNIASFLLVTNGPT